jgi:hypothetical protein
VGCVHPEKFKAVPTQEPVPISVATVAEDKEEIYDAFNEVVEINDNVTDLHKTDTFKDVPTAFEFHTADSDLMNY